MRYHSWLSAACSLVLSLSACQQEAVAPEQQISGRYALDNNGTTDTYLDFNTGRLTIYKSDEAYPLAEHKIWDCNEDFFKVNESSNYSITDGRLVSSWENFGKVEFSENKLFMQGKTYLELKGFESGPYSVIRPSKDRLDLSYAAETVELAVNVENALPAWSLAAETKTEWISDLKVESNVLRLKTSSTATDRSGVIELKYPHAETVSLPVSQKPSTFIKPASENLTFGYEASSQTLSYTIENPIAGSSLNATTVALWISDIQISDTQISFKLSENNSGADRSSSFSLSYGGAPNVIVPVTQKWSASSFTLTPMSQEAAYTGGSFNFSFSISNPHSDASVVAVSQDNWITDVAVSGNKVTYKVAENNSGALRTGKIKLTYGSYATAEFTVTQTWSASDFTLTPTSQETAYTGGSFNFSFSISHPHSDASVVAVSQDNWITDVAVSANKVTYKVAENNSGAQRTGKIKLTYGSYATAEFSVTQAWSASSFTLTPANQEVAYTGGSFGFDFAVNNPRADVNVVAASQANWITDVAVSGNKVIFKVTENNSGALRTGKIKLSYGSYATAEFTVMQKWSASSFILTPASQEVAYTGGSFNFSFSVSNPHSDASVVAVSLANWITDVVLNGNKVTYKVAENNSGTQRTGRIKLTYGSYATAEFTVTQKGTPVTSLSLNKSSLALHTGNSEKLVAIVEPSDATLAWSSSNTSVATVSSDGTVTAVGNGTATITVSATDGSGKNAKCTVAVTTLVSSITLDKTSLTLHPGESSTLTPTVLPSTASNKALTWTSSDNSVATVSTSGVVTAKGNGTATITVSATDGSGKNAKCTVTVMTLVSSVSLDKTSLELYKGDSFTLSATVSPSTASNKALTWTSSDNSVATVSNSGVVTAKGNGTATITVSATDGSGKNATCKVTVSIRPPEAIDMGTVLWSESWAGGAKDKTPAEYQALSTASTVVYGGGSVTYTSANGGSTTKLYDDALVYVPGNYSGSLAKPENPYNLLISKTNGWWKIAGIPCKDVAKAKLTIHSNYGTSSYFNPSSNTTGVSFGTMSATNYNSDWGKKVYVVTYEITFSGSAETFDLTLQNTNSGNVRVTDLSIEVTEAK
jgi:uncharacterized protein YjdB/uncharacterized membrane protein